MSIEELRIAVLNNRHDTQVAQAFRKAFGLPYERPPKPRRLTRTDLRHRERNRREYERMMHQVLGAMDRHGKA